MASTQKRITQLLFAWLALTVLILSTACSNPGSPSQPAAPPAPNANQQKRNPPKIVTAQTPSPTPLVNNVDTSRSSNENQSHEGDQSTISHDEVIDITNDTAPVGKSRGMTPEQLFGESNLATASLKDLFYSASSNDGLYEQIKNIEAQVKVDAHREANARFAKHVQFATFESRGNGRAQASISIVNAQNRIAQYNFDGQLDRDMHMRAQNSGYTIDAVCMDATRGCKTVHIRIQEKGAVAHVITRNNDASLYIQGNPIGTVHNLEFDRLMRIMLNTVKSSGAPDSVDELKLITSETVNGPSKFAVTFGLLVNSRHSNQVLSWTGDLVKPAKSNITDIVLKPAFGLETRGIAETVREARLVRNNGKGDIQIILTVRRGTPSAEEGNLRLTISRIATPVRELVLK